MLMAFRGAQDGRIDDICTDGLADRDNRSLHLGEEGRTGVFHEVTIGQRPERRQDGPPWPLVCIRGSGAAVARE